MTQCDTSCVNDAFAGINAPPVTKPVSDTAWCGVGGDAGGLNVFIALQFLLRRDAPPREGPGVVICCLFSPPKNERWRLSSCFESPKWSKCIRLLSHHSKWDVCDLLLRCIGLISHPPLCSGRAACQAASGHKVFSVGRIRSRRLGHYYYKTAWVACSKEEGHTLQDVGGSTIPIHGLGCWPILFTIFSYSCQRSQSDTVCVCMADSGSHKHYFRYNNYLKITEI